MAKDNSIDEFAQAVAALVPHAEPVAVERLALATRRLLESLADRAAVQSASAFMAAYMELRNVDNNARMVAKEQEERITAIEDREGEATAPT